MPDISRRAILRGATVAGAATVGGAAGFSTQSFLRDGELFESNSLQAGSLELEIATCSEFDGEQTCSPRLPAGESFPAQFEQGSTVDVAFPDIDTQDGAASGSTTIAYRSCDNPGRAWLRAYSEEFSDGEQSALADALEVELTYAADCGAEGTSLFEGSLSEFLTQYGDGARPREHCTELGKIELVEPDDNGNDVETFSVENEDGGDSLAVDDLPGTVTLQSDNGDSEVTIENPVYRKDDGEIIGVDVTCEDTNLCRADVKGGGKQETEGNNTGGTGNNGGKGNGGNGSKGNGGNGSKGNGGNGSKGNGGSTEAADPSGGVKTYVLGCTSEATALIAGDGPSGTQSGLSHFTLYGCGEETCLGCDPDCLTLDWELADATGLAGDELSVTLELRARQCRHTEATNPWQ